MSDQDKRKTKTVILRELEAIKGLLDDDEIPLLQEVIDSAEEETGGEQTLDGDDLAELQQAYRDLLQARGMESEESSGDQEPPILHDIETVPDETAIDDVPSSNRDQTGNDEDAAVTPAPAAPKPAAPITPVAAPTKEPWEEVQTSLFDTDNEPNEAATSANRHNSVIKASGENPFLPAHIRKRLQGSKPPPLFEPATPVSPGNAAPSTSRAQLVEDVVNSLLPQVRRKLRDALLELDAEQLRDLLNDKSGGHKSEKSPE